MATEQGFWSLLVCFMLFITNRGNEASQAAKKLYVDLLIKTGYNRLIRPVRQVEDIVNVRIGIKFIQLIDVVSFSRRMVADSVVPGLWFIMGTVHALLTLGQKFDFRGCQNVAHVVTIFVHGTDSDSRLGMFFHECSQCT